MTKKQTFIEEIGKLLKDNPEVNLSVDALDFWNSLQVTGDAEKPKFTENGKRVLNYMKENKDTYNNLFKSKDIGEQLGISSRTVSGSMRKLVNDGYVEKMGENPIVYALTSEGEKVNLDEE